MVKDVTCIILELGSRLDASRARDAGWHRSRASDARGGGKGGAQPLRELRPAIGQSVSIRFSRARAYAPRTSGREGRAEISNVCVSDRNRGCTREAAQRTHSTMPCMATVSQIRNSNLASCLCVVASTRATGSRSLAGRGTPQCTLSCACFWGDLIGGGVSQQFNIPTPSIHTRAAMERLLECKFAGEF